MYIRKSEEKRIGSEVDEELMSMLDLQQDWVMIYSLDHFLDWAEAYREKAEFIMKAADKVKAFTRLRLPKEVTSCSAVDETGAEVAMSWSWDERTQTALFGYESINREIAVTVQF